MHEDPHVDVSAFDRLEKVQKGASVVVNTGTALKIVLSAVASVVVFAVSGAIWGHTRASIDYVDTKDRSVTLADMEVHRTQGAKLESIDVRLERVATALEAQAGINADHGRRLVEVESKASACNAILARRP